MRHHLRSVTIGREPLGTFTLTAQVVNGDPFLSPGSNINITTSTIPTLTFYDIDNLLDIPVAGEFVSIDGGVTLLSYQLLGYGDVRGDPLQHAAFVRINNGDGTFTTVAIDMDGSQPPDLSKGNTKLSVNALSYPSPPEGWPVPCFVSGTLIETATGLRCVEQIEVGDLVLTRDDGLQPVIWSGHTEVQGIGKFAPVRFSEGAIGNVRELFLSPQHRVLMQGWKAQLFLGLEEVLVPAVFLINGSTIRQIPQKTVRYHHLMFKEHQIIYSEGTLTESFSPGEAILGEDTHLRKELEELFPDQFPTSEFGAMRLARTVAKRYEAKLLT